MNTPDLPPLPEPMYDARGPRPYGQSYSATQMRAYAAAAVLAEQAKSDAMRAAAEQALAALTYQGTMGPTRRQRRHAAIESLRAAIRAEPKEQQP
jgi:galactokinase